MDKKRAEALRQFLNVDQPEIEEFEEKWDDNKIIKYQRKNYAILTQEELDNFYDDEISMVISKPEDTTEERVGEFIFNVSECD